MGIANEANYPVTEAKARIRLETEALVIGYAMSRLDSTYLELRGLNSWQAAFREAGNALSVPAASFKNLRDEFDPVHGNRRSGWHGRPLRPTRQRVLDELVDLSSEALFELVARIISRDAEETNVAIDSLAVSTKVAHNVAERLLTGRRAEEYLIEYSQMLLGISSEQLLDHRQAAIGFDFGVSNRSELAIEVKGMKTAKGSILFTDREWSEARYRNLNYWLVVVGDIETKPKASVIKDPYHALDCQCSYQPRLTAQWKSTVSVASGIQLGGSK